MSKSTVRTMKYYAVAAVVCGWWIYLGFSNVHLTDREVFLKYWLHFVGGFVVLIFNFMHIQNQRNREVKEVMDAQAERVRRYKEMDMSKEKIFSGNLTASEALYGFMGWLTARDESVTFGAKHDSAIAVDLIKKFCQTNHLDDPREDWIENLIHPPMGKTIDAGQINSKTR